jgi:hypothetical protein
MIGMRYVVTTSGKVHAMEESVSQKSGYRNTLCNRSTNARSYEQLTVDCPTCIKRIAKAEKKRGTV